MSTKTEKSSPVAIPEKLFTDCCSEESVELPPLFDKLNKCNTVYEQMNCFGILKQKTRNLKVLCLYVVEGASKDIYRFVCCLLLLPETQALRKSTNVLSMSFLWTIIVVTLYFKKDKESIVNIYSDLTDLLLSNDFKLPYGSTNESTHWSLWF